FVVFDFMAGRPANLDPESGRLFGEALGRVYAAARSFDGEGSRFRHDLATLLQGQTERLAAVHYFDDALRDEIRTLAVDTEKLHAPAVAGLVWQVCHGDPAPVNCHIVKAQDGSRGGGIIDFEFAGPGWLAYELSHCLFHRIRFGKAGVYTDDYL